ncbi:hypothetical protein [Aquimarina sp. 2201CG5-10]|uniref:hypothetical protein n=1 Tax=Aquimarina callyspongiae TaxID=3098150 RepID=UPI002AB5D45F|nr:hypothetical protein [Aquimarina sp. 2201CG5-10]MDY8136987.1 hypothetical protein [Aquimarina sp. 2201CG5-10]
MLQSILNLEGVKKIERSQLRSVSGGGTCGSGGRCCGECSGNICSEYCEPL